VKNRFQNLPFKFNLQRYSAGISQANWRKMCNEAGLLGDAFAPAAVDIVYARCRAPGSDVMTWGEFLRAVGYVAEQTGAMYGNVVRGCTS
jgi:hypothetical protein